MKVVNFWALSLISLGIVLSFGFNSKGVISKFHISHSELNTGGAPAGRTGAPGEQSCTACHSGTIMDGNAGVNLLELSGGGNEYIPDEINSLQLTFTDAAIKNGFQLVVLNDADEMAGSLVVTDAVNTKFLTSAFLNREYITHTSNGTTLNTWEFDWISPATGGDVTFYVATNKTNSNSQSSGDVVYVSEHVFTAPDLVGLAEQKIVEPKLNVGYQSTTGQVVLDFDVTSVKELSLNITDLSGKSVFFQNMGTFNPGSYSDKINVNKLNHGIYVVTLFMNNKPLSGKIMVQ